MSAASIIVRTSANENKASTAIGAALKVLEIGQLMKDGTYYIGISPDTKEEVFVPKGIITGAYNFSSQSQGPAKLNEKKKHGYTDWDNPSRGELHLLCNAWEKVAPKNLRASSAPWLWSSSPSHSYAGWAQKPGDTDQCSGHRVNRLAVPAVRRGPGRS